MKKPNLEKELGIDKWSQEDKDRYYQALDNIKESIDGEVMRILLGNTWKTHTPTKKDDGGKFSIINKDMLA